MTKSQEEWFNSTPWMQEEYKRIQHQFGDNVLADISVKNNYQGYLAQSLAQGGVDNPAPISTPEQGVAVAQQYAQLQYNAFVQQGVAPELAKATVQQTVGSSIQGKDVNFDALEISKATEQQPPQNVATVEQSAKPADQEPTQPAADQPAPAEKPNEITVTIEAKKSQLPLVLGIIGLLALIGGVIVLGGESK